MSEIRTEATTAMAMESVLSGHSTFFTGPAGSGKSHVLSSILRANALHSSPRRMVVTATTGIAACNIGGTTVHSFAGVGVGSGTPASLVRRVMGNEYAKTRWREVDVLIIDEISMMAGNFLEKLAFVASRARNDRRPFGGVQLVVCGDFFQLPPVDLKKEGFAFEAECWTRCITCSVLLKQVFRQRGDARLMAILDEARLGTLSKGAVDLLRRHQLDDRSNKSKGSNALNLDIIPTLLECKNKQVDRANEREMSKLTDTESHTYDARDRAISDSHKSQLRHCQATAKLELKVGAQVMLLKNIDPEKGLVNGSRGVVVRFQLPNASTMGDVPRGFKNLEMPVVRFDAVKVVGRTAGDGECGEEEVVDEEDMEFVIQPEEWTNKVGEQTVSARVQIPLRLAWAISVHKSQGMTIPNLTVNLAGVFEYGQAYVALSRATELKLLTLKGFTEKAFRAHPKVKEFYRLLDDPDSTNSSRGDGNEKENRGSSAEDATTTVATTAMSSVHQQQQWQSKTGATSMSRPNPRTITASSSSSYARQQQQQQPPPQSMQQQTSGPFNPYASRSGGGGGSYNGGVGPLPPPAPGRSTATTPPNPYSSVSSSSSSATTRSLGSYSSSSLSSSTKVSPTFTPEQLRRMEENRQRALTIQMQKQQREASSGS